jgi:hypothetical protein
MASLEWSPRRQFEKGTNRPTICHLYGKCTGRYNLGILASVVKQRSPNACAGCAARGILGFQMRLSISSLFFCLAASIAVAQTRSLFTAPDELLQDAVNRQLNDQTNAAQFTYVELWQNHNFGDKSQQLSSETAKFESIVLHGKPYLRKVEENGEPLSQDIASREEHNYDLAIQSRRGITIQDRIDSSGARTLGLDLQLDLLPTHFHSAILGTEIVNGRRAILLDCYPRKNIRPKDEETARGMQVRMRVWIAFGKFSWPICGS